MNESIKEKAFTFFIEPIGMQYKCKICNIFFKDLEQIRIHIEIEHMKELYERVIELTKNESQKELIKNIDKMIEGNCLKTTESGHVHIEHYKLNAEKYNKLKDEYEL